MRQRGARAPKVQQFYEAHRIVDADEVKPPPTKRQFTLIGCREKLLNAVSYLVSLLTRLLCALRLMKDIDPINECIDCGARFTCLEWGRRCAGCDYKFCSACLSKTHIVDTAVSPESPPLVCSFCFFTHCARLCGSRCCRNLPVREVRRFLSRKGISVAGALEKDELFEGIQQWATDLASATDFKAGDDIEAVIRIQDAECNTTRESAPYAATDTSSYEHFPVSELRARLDEMGIDHRACVEKADLVQLLTTQQQSA